MSENSNRAYEDEDIVITGISGRFPLADNVEELKENLYSKKNCIVPAEERWSSDTPGCPLNLIGKIKDLATFDADFFNVAPAAANMEDPQNRIMLEVAYEAIVDAGYGPKELSGKRIGVFVGVSDPDCLGLERNVGGAMGHKNASGYVGCMLANKVSHKFDFRGPSFIIDSSCSSSGVALEEAFHRMQTGDLEAAIVGGSALCLDPRINSIYLGLGILSPTCSSCPYDEKANGMTKGEAISAILLQKKKDARRIYCRVLDVQCDSAGLVPEGVYVPSTKANIALFQKTYERIGMDPTKIGYVEGHGTSILTGDSSEVNSLCEVFCKGRENPLLLGGIKSNIGHTEAASALSSIAKVILAFESGVIAPNINYETPNSKCPALLDGRIKVITEPTPYDLPVAALNSFGLGGVSVHVVLERSKIERQPDEQSKRETVPKLVVYAATTEKALTDMFKRFHQNPKSKEFYSLLNKSAYHPPLMASYRGFTILDDQEQPIITVEQTSPVERQVWYVFTGMGCQWPGMGLELMKLEVFAESMKKSAKVLEPFGINLLELLRTDKNYLQEDRNITPAFVTITAIQIALFDVLNALGLQPDGIIGHSTGELVSSYADGCCTAEETLLSAYYRGISVERSNLPPGAMAAIGLSWEETKKRCPEGVYPACDNAEDSVTISGSKDAVENFVAQLTSENIFARIVNAYGYAFHCKSVAAASGALKDSLQKVYLNPKPRTKRWVSTSFKETEWDTRECQIIDSDYFCHNLISEVHFREAMAHIPRDAITIEIGPHFLLQSILKRSIGSKASYIGLMKRNHDRNVEFLLSSIGKLYNLGLDPRVENLYPSVSYPVPRGTPMISPFIQWDHSQTFHVPKYTALLVGKTRVTAKTSSADSYLLDHCIEGRSLYPAAGYIYLVWRAISDSLQKPMETLPIMIENLKILRATILSPKSDKSFEISILNLRGEFEIVEGGSAVATGKISVPTKPMFRDADLKYEQEKSTVSISGKEMYDELRIHGYEYGPAFQGLLEVDIEGTSGLVEWNDRWISFLDSLLLFFGIIDENIALMLPTGALSIKIDPRVHTEFVSGMPGKGFKGIPVKYNKNVKKCTAPGVEIRNLKLESAPRRPLIDIVPVWEGCRFTPYFDKNVIPEENYKYEEYIDVCCILARRVVEKLESCSKIGNRLLNYSEISKSVDIQGYLARPDENHAVLEAIQNAVELTRSERVLSKTLLNENLSEIISKDILFQTVFHENFMRPLLDITVENSFGKMAFVEWCDSSPVLLPSVQIILKSCTQLKMSCTIIHPQTKPIEISGLTKNNIFVERTTNNSDIPSSFKDYGDVVLTCFITGSRDSLKSRLHTAASLAKEKGFILVIHKHKMSLPEEFLSLLTKNPFSQLQTEAEMEKAFSEENIVVVSKRSNNFGVTGYLLRKVPNRTEETQNHVIEILDDKYNQWVPELKKAMILAQKKDSSNMVWLVAQDSPTNGIIGMVLCLKQEPGGDKIRCIFTDKTAPTFNIKSPFYADVMKKNLLMNVYRNGTWGSFRHTRLPEERQMSMVNHACVECTKFGALSSFKWFENPVKYVPSLEQGNELYHVYYSALNFRDVLLATGKISSNVFVTDSHLAPRSLIGLEFTGRDINGRRIMAMGPGGGFSTTFIGRTLFMYEIPDHWTMEEAATIPVAYSTAYLALIIAGRLKYGEKILIHSGTGAVGQAAIRIALSMDCEVFSTVGTPEKRKFLLETFPQVKPENVGCSRDTTFEEMIMMQTQGKGVDVILNSLADDKFQASVRCLARHGRFLEIGKYDIQLDRTLGLNVFLKDISFHGIMLDRYLVKSKKSEEVRIELRKLFEEGIKKGVIQPLNSTVFPIQEIQNAFCYMSTGKHIGKILLKVREEEAEKMVVPAPIKMKGYKTFSLYPNKSYIIVGGLGGFGIDLAKWLVQKDAGTVVLTSRYGPKTPYHHFCLRRWKEIGAKVVVSTFNVANRQDAKKLLEEVTEKYGPIGGVFNSAVVLRDAFMENQSAADFEEVCAPKALATKHLDELAREMCPELNLFVCFSSISCGKGNAGQSNYGYANSVMERICEQRKHDGLHGLAIQWGIIGEAGLVHRHMGEDAMIAGVMAQKIKSCLRSLEEFLIQDIPVVSSFVTADNAKVARRSDDVLGQLAKVFNVPDIDQINPYRTFGEMGIDSMAGVELKQLVESTFDLSLTAQDIQDMKLSDIKKFMEEKDRNKNVSSTNQKKNIEIRSIKILTPSEPILILNNCKEGTPLFVIYGNDLMCEEHKKLWEDLKSPVLAIRGTRDMPMNSLTDMAVWYLRQIWMVCSDSPVHILSMSTAANLVLEMLLQSRIGKAPQPTFKRWTIIDGSLELIGIHTTTKQEKNKNAPCYEALDLCRYLSYLSESELTGLEKELEQQTSLESRMNMIVSLVTLSEKLEFIEAAERFVKRQHLIRSETPKVRLQEDLTIIEATEKVLPNDVSIIKSFMSNICSGQISIHRIEGSKDFPAGSSSAAYVSNLLNKLNERNQN